LYSYSRINSESHLKAKTLKLDRIGQYTFWKSFEFRHDKNLKLLQERLLFVKPTVDLESNFFTINFQSNSESRHRLKEYFVWRLPSVTSCASHTPWCYGERRTRNKFALSGGAEREKFASRRDERIVRPSANGYYNKRHRRTFNGRCSSILYGIKQFRNKAKYYHFNRCGTITLYTYTPCSRVGVKPLPRGSLFAGIIREIHSRGLLYYTPCGAGISWRYSTAIAYLYPVTNFPILNRVMPSIFKVNWLR